MVVIRRMGNLIHTINSTGRDDGKRLELFPRHETRLTEHE